MSPSGTCDVASGSPSLHASSPDCAFSLGRLSELWDEALPLIHENHRETGVLGPAEFAPDRSRYELLEKAGVTIVYQARVAGALVGYALFILSLSHLHYAGTSWAMQDVLYVAPAHRGRHGIRFIRWQDAQLAAQGLDLVYRHNCKRKDYGRVLERLGYQPEEVRYVRDLRVLRAAVPTAPERQAG